MLFLDLIITLSTDIRVHRAGSQLIINYEVVPIHVLWHRIPRVCFNCSLCSKNEQGDIAHILIQCTSLAQLRRHLCSKLDQYPISDTSRYLITTVLNSGDTNNIVHFLLDCSTIPEVISATQSCGQWSA